MSEDLEETEIKRTQKNWTERIGVALYDRGKAYVASSHKMTQALRGAEPEEAEKPHITGRERREVLWDEL